MTSRAITRDDAVPAAAGHVALVLLYIFLWSSGFAPSRVVLREIPALWVLGTRLIIAGRHSPRPRAGAWARVSAHARAVERGGRCRRAGERRVPRAALRRVARHVVGDGGDHREHEPAHPRARRPCPARRDAAARHGARDRDRVRRCRVHDVEPHRQRARATAVDRGGVHLRAGTRRVDRRLQARGVSAPHGHGGDGSATARRQRAAPPRGDDRERRAGDPARRRGLAQLRLSHARHERRRVAALVLAPRAWRRDAAQRVLLPRAGVRAGHRPRPARRGGDDARCARCDRDRGGDLARAAGVVETGRPKLRRRRT